jgi:hypothetical protein
MLDGISLDEEIQSRVELSQEYVREYAKDLLGDHRFPPVIIFNDGENYYLADGFHRYEAHKIAGLETIRAEVRDGSKRDAILFAVGCNSAHGKRRTNQDKRKAVEKLLSDPDWRCWSDNEIAKTCSVSQPFVSKLRNEPPYNGYKFEKKRLCANGQVMDTSKIGGKSKANDSEVLHPTQRPLSEYQQFKAHLEKASEAPTALLNPYTYEDNPDLLKQSLIRAREELKMQIKFAKWLESKVERLKKENQSLKKKLERVNAV